jgi:hypothetical protein
MDLSEFLGRDGVVFAGAGISRAAPASAPLWRELQTGFLTAVYERLRAEHWPILERGGLADQDVLLRFQFRPETFWAIVSHGTSFETVRSTFAVLEGGDPNFTHRLLARCLTEQRIAAVITTNFDEYIETASPPNRRVVSEGDANDALTVGEPGGWLVKLHGTLESPASLRFTLEHIHQLSEPLAACIGVLMTGRSVLIVGYSGYDEDILPAVRDGVRLARRVVVVVHPGSSGAQPILSLADAGAEIVEADASHLFAEAGTAMELDLAAAPQRNPPAKPTTDERYATAVRDVPHIALTLTLCDLHGFAGNPQGALEYALLARDVAEDGRYADASRPYRGALRAHDALADRLLGGHGSLRRAFASGGEDDF